MKVSAITAIGAATGAGPLASRPTSPSSSPSGSSSANPNATMRRSLLLGASLGALALLSGVVVMVGKGRMPAAGSRFLSQRVLVRSSTTTPARRLSLPSASLTGACLHTSYLRLH